MHSTACGGGAFNSTSIAIDDHFSRDAMCRFDFYFWRESRSSS